MPGLREEELLRGADGGESRAMIPYAWEPDFASAKNVAIGGGWVDARLSCLAVGKLILVGFVLAFAGIDFCSRHIGLQVPGVTFRKLVPQMRQVRGRFVREATQGHEINISGIPSLG